MRGGREAALAALIDPRVPGVLGIFPSLEIAHRFPGGPNHGEDVLTHLILCCRGVDPKRPLLRLAALLHDCGKPFCHEDGRFRGHERESAKMAGGIMAGLGFPENEIRHVQALIGAHMINLERISPRRLKARLRALEDAGASWRDFARLRIADRRANLKRAGERVDIRAIVSKCREALAIPDRQPKSDLAVSGHDVMDILGIGPGPEVGRILARLGSLVESGAVPNDRGRLLLEIREAA